MKVDAKPQLGPAAIECNIAYYAAKGAKAAHEYRLALEQGTYWLREQQRLVQENKNTL